MRSRRPSVVVCIVVLAGTLLGPRAASAEATPAPTLYQPPVDAPLRDTFRPPATPYGPGNRGIDYATTEGQPVRAAADGEVVFAGRIGASSHVTVLHGDGVRTSYSFVDAPVVRRGDHVTRGQVVATSTADGLHFGARAGDAYVDPLVLLGQVSDRQRQAWLVDDPDPTVPLSEAEERNLLVEALRGVARRVTATVEQKIDLARILADDALDLAVPMSVHLALAAHRWRLEQAAQPPRCSAPTVTTTPPAHRPRRVVVLVGGLGSATGDAAVLDVDTAALGYAPKDVHQFNYVDGDSKPYGPADTQGDIGRQGARLAADIAALQRASPSTPVDVIAHSQGGLVARAAITTHHAAPATVVTLGTPHQGADLATAGAGLDATASGGLLLDAATLATRPAAGVDLNSTSIRQMSETSDFLASLPEEGWDPGITHVVAVAARRDPIVPNHQAALHSDDAYRTVVSPYGGDSLDAHSRLPGSPEATREIALALDRRPPTCRTLEEALLDAFVGRATSDAHDRVGATLAAAGLYADARTRQTFTVRSR